MYGKELVFMEKGKKKSTFVRLLEFTAHCQGKMVTSIILAVLGVACSMVPYADFIGVRKKAIGWKLAPEV